jgi:hypothetical protein
MTSNASVTMDNEIGYIGIIREFKLVARHLFTLDPFPDIEVLYAVP